MAMRLRIGLAAALAFAAMCVAVVAADADAIKAVSSHLSGPGNKLGVKAAGLQTKANPKGEGTFVYVAQTRFSGVKRYVVWLVLDGKPYPLNGATKGSVTPDLPWPREAKKEDWARTGLDPYVASEAIKIVYGDE